MMILIGEFADTQEFRTISFESFQQDRDSLSYVSNRKRVANAREVVPSQLLDYTVVQYLRKQYCYL